MEVFVRTSLQAVSHLFGISGLLVLYACWPEPARMLEGALYLSLAAIISWSTEKRKSESRR